MKITKAELQKIIAEEIQNVNELFGMKFPSIGGSRRGQGRARAGMRGKSPYETEEEREDFWQSGLSKKQMQTYDAATSHAKVMDQELDKTLSADITQLEKSIEPESIWDRIDELGKQLEALVNHVQGMDDWDLD